MRFRIPPDHPCLAGHFPGNPVVPGVVLLDRVLEAIERRSGPTGPLRLPQAKFLQPLKPGEEARVELPDGDPSDGSLPAGRWRFRVLRDDTVLATGEFAAGTPPVANGP